MTEGSGRAQTLSRASNHLGNLANALKDLGGGATLLNELTQNGDDAGAKSVRLTAAPDALIVWNSAPFTDCGIDDPPPCPWQGANRPGCDLHSFRDVSGRNKEFDSESTGAFGIGFTAVYQVTDHPELLFGGRHLLVDEAAREDERLKFCDGGCETEHDLPGTTLILPWARLDSPLRRHFRVSPLSDADINVVIDEMHEAAADSALFLRNVRELVVESEGRVTEIQRVDDGDRIRITAGGNVDEWFILSAAADGAALREHHPQINPGRDPLVKVAFPLGMKCVGRVYATLPTEARTGWNGHINGTFYPRQDRKGIEFDGTGYRGRWNDALVEAAARAVADNLETLTDAVGPEAVWTYLLNVESIAREASDGVYPRSFASFAHSAQSQAVHSKIALTLDGQLVIPQACVVPQSKDDYAAASALTHLGQQVLHPRLRAIALQLPGEYGMRRLTLGALVATLANAGLDEPWLPPEGPLTVEELEEVLRLLERLQEAGRRQLEETGVADLALVTCVDGTVAPASGVSVLDDDERVLFELLDPTLKIVDSERLERLCPSLISICTRLTPERAVTLFERDLEALAVAPQEILEWLANHRLALNDAAMRARIRELPVFPSAGGGYRPLSTLSLPSSFEDPLNIAAVVDKRRVQGFEDLLRLLECRELDAIEYLQTHVLSAAAAGTLQAEQLLSILQIVARERESLHGELELRRALALAPLIWCSDGIARPAAQVHLPSPLLSRIDPEAPTAEVSGARGRLVDTMVWLGVSRRPDQELLSRAASRLATQQPEPPSDAVLAILEALPDPLPADVPEGLRNLTSEHWLPVEGGGRAAPPRLYAVFRRETFESQGPKLGLARAEQNRHSEQLQWLGVHPNPTTAMVVAHLRHCAATATPMSTEVYRYLAEGKSDHRLVAPLASEACVQVAPGEFAHPSLVFWVDEGLGRWACVLTPAHQPFRAFFDLVGVAERPEASHLERVLREISRQVGNDYLDDEDVTVVHRCWELLEQRLVSPGYQQATTSVLHNLGRVRCVVDARGVLAAPDQLLFLDGRRLAEKFVLLSQNLIRRDTTERALATAGVTPAEDVIETIVDPSLSPQPAPSLSALVSERRAAIRRLFMSSDAELPADPDRLDSVEFQRAPELAVKYRARFKHQVEETTFQQEEAVHLADQRLMLVRSMGASRALARELARCIAPRTDVAAIASSLFEVLDAPTVEVAMRVLDEYGVRDLDDTNWGRVPTRAASHLEPAGSPDGDMSTRPSDPPEPSGASRPPSPQSETDGSSGAETAAPGRGSRSDSGPGSRAKSSQSPGQRHRQRRARLVSYVVVGGSDEDGYEKTGEDLAERTAVDQAGVRRVLEHERGCGRMPEEQRHGNRGFDVVSRDASGRVVRWIEIKSTAGTWDALGVFMSRAQLEDNRDKGSRYWLYVVDNAEDDEAFRIHRIQDPWSQASKFGFDSGWQAVAEPELERDDAGDPLVKTTLRLLGWRPGS